MSRDSIHGKRADQFYGTTVVPEDRQDEATTLLAMNESAPYWRRVLARIVWLVLAWLLCLDAREGE
jgi:hypothetical protein